MTIEHRDLWPDDIQVEEVLTPFELMEFQAGRLQERTNGMLEAVVESNTERGRMTHSFEILASELSGYRYRLFQVDHSESMPYPARVLSACFAADDEPWTRKSKRDVATQLEFEESLEFVLKSPETRSVIQSLIARISVERKKLKS